jgi:hypothetical protein
MRIYFVHAVGGYTLTASLECTVLLLLSAAAAKHACTTQQGKKKMLVLQ